MLKAIKIRLYPTFQQKEMLNRHFNGVRYLYNLGLEYKQTIYKSYGIKTSKFDLINQLPDVKEAAPWLNLCKAECLQTTFDNLDSAFKGFYQGAGFPKFKSKRGKQSFVQKQNFKILENINHLVFYKQKIKFKCSIRDTQDLRTGKIKRIIYSKDNLGHYYASVLIEYDQDLTLPKLDSKVGIDLGIKHFLVTSKGEYIKNPKFLKSSEKKLAKEQRKLSRKKKGSKNRDKQRIKVVKIHQKITNQRNHFFHQVTNKLINENQVIKVETLNVKGMIQNRRLSKSIQDASWSKFISILDYKSSWCGRSLDRIDRFYPSSKTCSNCGWIDENLTLSDRTFKCQSCRHTQDRDLNAAINIENFNRDELARINASGQQVLTTGRRKKRTSKKLSL